METLAYLHLALAAETPLQVSQSEQLDGRKSSHAALYFLPIIIALGVLGMASQTLADTIVQGGDRFRSDGDPRAFATFGLL